ncbi:hypothetical protein HXX76_002712 [Chlamydomonas incerta]|uniref:EamA domain-containing protein n=1 Tax=Chlamydomonas incerta TaxID=51695 RepID=A0A835TBW9_CHLIN|nr:hypothetical protein HXX76_002712 [Chlamydomonas incerta]|eukprot:KAG2442627.1 hypothetical protein HXX76_002712 [Chlamydomonas incerta]
MPDASGGTAAGSGHGAGGHGGTHNASLQGRLRQAYGAGILLVTAVLWASGGPTMKYLFLLPAPPSAALVTACISVSTALFLMVGLLGSAMEQQTQPPPGEAAADAEAAGGASGVVTSAGADGWGGGGGLGREAPPLGAAAVTVAAEEGGTAGGGRARGGGGGLLGSLWRRLLDLGGSGPGSGSGLGLHTKDNSGSARGSQAIEAEVLLASGMHAAGGGALGGGGGMLLALQRMSDGGGSDGALAALLAAEPEGRGGLHHRHVHVHGHSHVGGAAAADAAEVERAHRATALVESALGPAAQEEVAGSGSGTGTGTGRAAGGAGPDSVFTTAGAPPGRHLNGAAAAPGLGPGPARPSLDGILASPLRPAALGGSSSPGPSKLSSTHSSALGAGADPGGAPRRRSLSGGGAFAGPDGRDAAASAAGGCCGGWRLAALTAPARSLAAAGMELGCYNTAAAALGAWGYQRISATRAAFLMQATALITPLLVVAGGGRVGPLVWLACGAGAAGGAMVALDQVQQAGAAAAAAAGGGDGGGSSSSSSSGGGSLLAESVSLAATAGTDLARRLLPQAEAGLGAAAAAAAATAAGPTNIGSSITGSSTGSDGEAALTGQAMGVLYILASCLVWGMVTVRLGVHSARYPPLQLAAAAAITYAGLALLWLLAEIMSSPGAGLGDYLELGLLLRNHTTAALLLWAGLGPGALSSYMQVLGQTIVPPAQAQVLFSSTPLWAALMAGLLLPGESMGPLAWLGGAVMLGASLLASLLT